jgi:membrane protease YdiL (CAAX protease family)
MIRVELRSANPTLEAAVVTGGVFLFTALYYTRIPRYQVLSFLVLIMVAAYLSYAVRRGPGMSWSDFKLTKDRLWRNVFIAIGLAVFGWLYFSVYNYWTRGRALELGYGGSFAAILTILAVSIAEELFFRGYLQNRLSYRCSLWSRVLIAVAALAFYKNVIHMWEGLPLVMHLELFFLGILHNILPSLWMEWSGSLVGPLVLHVVWDLLVYAPLPSIPYWVI